MALKETAQDQVGEIPPALAALAPPPAVRKEEGRSRRSVAPRSSFASWEPSPDRPDPVELLVEMGRSRLQDLLPVRHRRMLDSPFAFYRGSAVQMAYDLAPQARTGLDVQLCGDAHLSNFGVFASPERTLVFDLNDFDETWPGPFEWDVQRLVASCVLASRANGHSAKDGRTAAQAAAASYRQRMAQYAAMTTLDVWYSRVDAEDVVNIMRPSARGVAAQVIAKASGKGHLKALDKLTTVVDGTRRIVADPPLVVRAADDVLAAQGAPVMIEEYRSTLQPDRRALFDSYRLVDLARKVVGVGSVGTRCWILLFQGPNGGPLFLQMKEAQRAAPERAGLPGAEMHHGRRVVEGQRRLQSASDVLLGWTSNPVSNVDFYVRQLWDAKGSAELIGMSPTTLADYSTACAWALARAHARTADAVAISGYLGNSDTFDKAMAGFAERYADQAERDHQAMRKAADSGHIPVAPSAV